MKAEGKKAAFANMIGWLPQHMTRVTKLDGTAVIGLAVIERILISFPDVNARWLILGEGEMLLKPTDSELIDKMDNSNKVLQEVKSLLENMVKNK